MTLTVDHIENHIGDVHRRSVLLSELIEAMAVLDNEGRNVTALITIAAERSKSLSHQIDNVSFSEVQPNA